MQLHEIKTNNTSSKRVGRGGKRGKTAGRGHKGQKARAGHRIRPAVRDIIKKIPKRRGHGKNRARTFNPENTKPEIVNVSDIQNTFSKGESVSPDTLLEKGLVKRQKGRIPAVKILSKGEISIPVSITGCKFSQTAKDKIEKAGGTISE